MADFTGEPNVVIAIPHRRIHQGVFYSADKYVSTLANNTSFDLLVDIGDNNSHSVLTWNVGGDCEARWFEDTTVSANGTEIPSFNHARFSSNVALTKVYHGPTITDDGAEQSDGKFIPAGSGPLASGGSDSFDNEVVLKANTKYLFRVTNRSGNTIILSADLDWYESIRPFGSDDFFTATDEWQAVQMDSTDITNGTFSVKSNGTRRVDFLKSDTIPTVDHSYASFTPKEKSFKYTLGISEKLWCKTHGNVEIFQVIAA